MGVDLEKDINYRKKWLLISLSIILLIAVIASLKYPIASLESNKKTLNPNTKREWVGLRGNIYDHAGNVLTQSLPIFEIRFDTQVYKQTSENDFETKVKQIAKGLARILNKKSSATYYEEIIDAHKRKRQYFLLAKKVSYEQLVKIRKLPIFNLGRYKGGLIESKSYIRSHPYGELAIRTLGYGRSKNDVGIEEYFNNELRGPKTILKTNKNDKSILLDSINHHEKRGKDIYTTLDINIQEIAHHTLHKALVKHQADHGVLAVMEVRTGKIRALVNLSKTSNKEIYREKENLAISKSHAPASTFKTASYLACLEDKIFDLSERVDTGNKGWHKYKSKRITDIKPFGTLSMEEAFVKSSNIAIAKQIIKHYKSNTDIFTNNLKKLGVHLPTNVTLNGEASPTLKEKNNPNQIWSSYTRVWNSFGYELSQTPLQILMFYNAIANNGKMIAPLLVDKIKDNEKIKYFKTKVIKDSIAKKENIEIMQYLLRQVVVKGSAKNINNTLVELSGKTGTAQVYENKRYLNTKHRALFCGYFPSNKPKYTSIVVIYHPKKGGYSGSYVAAPIFAELAKKIYKTDFELTPSENSNSKFNIYIKEKQQKIAEKKNMDVTLSKNKTESVSKNVTPNLVGLDLSTALFKLSQIGINPTIVGKKIGRVYYQSIPNGRKIQPNSTMILKLKL